MKLLDRARAGTVTTGSLVVLGVEASYAAVSDIIRRRFSWTEFLLQAWFMVKVSLLPTILVAIPFGVITSVQVSGIAGLYVPALVEKPASPTFALAVTSSNFPLPRFRNRWFGPRQVTYRSTLPSLS